MNDFDFRRPESVQAAVQALRDDPDAKLLAGGQSLLAAVKLGLAAPTALLDLGAIDALRDLRREGAGVWIGAMCTHAQVASSALVQTHVPVIAQLAGGIADQQVRNRGTLGGSIANADPAACWPAGLLALGAVVQTDRRTIEADEFFQGLFTTALEADELVCGVWFPDCTEASYVKFEQPASRFALVGVAVARLPQGVRVAITGLGNGVLRWAEAEAALNAGFDVTRLNGLRLREDLASGDLHASAQYRCHLAGVMTRRAVGSVAQWKPGAPHSYNTGAQA